jgi:hypothetical protein
LAKLSNNEELSRLKEPDNKFFMKSTYIEIKEVSSSTIKGWTARVYTNVDALPIVQDKNESVIFQSKKASWESLKKKVEKLDFEKNKVYFNSKKVSSYTDVELEVSTIEEKIYTTKEQNDTKKRVKIIKK